MKFLILTASTGAGHNQAANNLKKEIEKNNDTAIVYDFFKNRNKNFFEKAYEIFVNNIPDVYGVIYSISNKKYLNKFLLKNIFINTSIHLKEVIEKEKPDVIIATHPFAVPIVSRLKFLFKIDIAFIQIVTDFEAHYTYIDKRVDAYITGSEFTKETIVKKGISSKKVFSFGIPVKEEFKESNKKYNRNILIMGGSLGLKNMEKCLSILIDSKIKIGITVICGRNTKLQKRLTMKFKNYVLSGKVKIFGFTDKISDIMDESMLLVTKPGGLTTTEAISKGLPMIIPFSIPGQEEENTKFLANSSMAIEIKNISELPNHINFLLNNKDEYNKMVRNMKMLAKTYSTSSIIDIAKNIYNRKQLIQKLNEMDDIKDSDLKL